MLIKYKRGFLTFCVILVMGVIFGFSSQTYKQTMKTSNIITIPIENQVKKENLEFKSEKEKKDYLKKLKYKVDKIVRKSAHIFIFGILAVFLYLLCKSFGMEDADAIILTLVLCAVYAGSDEWHQKFVDGRTSQFIDVCVDEFGAVIALIICRLLKKVKSDK